MHGHGGLSRVKEEGERGEYYLDGAYGGGGGGYTRRDERASHEQRQTASGVSWSIKPVCAERTKRSSAMPLRKSWHAAMGTDEGGAGGGGAQAGAALSTAPIAAPMPPSSSGRQPLSPSSRNAYDPLAQRDRRTSSERLGPQPDLAPPHTPPNHAHPDRSLWAKRRDSSGSPSNLPENLQLVSLKAAHAWDELQSPLDAFARKHCPNRSRHSHGGSSVATSHHSGGSHPSGGAHPHVGARFSIETEDELGPASPSWDRASNHSPLAALLRREFPAGGPEGAKLHSERRLFDDL